MIDLIKNFDKIEKPLTTLLNGHKENYKQSKAYTNLTRRIDTLKSSNDMNYGSGFASRLGFPIQKATSLMRKFVFDQSYRSEQLLYVKPSESTDSDTARKIEDTLNDNFRRTRFRSMAFNSIKLNCSDYGTAVCYSIPGILRQPHYKTKVETDEMGDIISTERVYVDTPDIVIMNKNIDPRNFIQDPDCVNSEESLYVGHIERWDIPEFVSYVTKNKQYLIKKNVSAIMDRITKSGALDRFYFEEQNKTLSKYVVDVTFMYSTANIKGNEDNLIPYYFEIADNKIVRIEKHMFDENLRPYSVIKFMPRNDVWWGNTDGELKLPHENAINTLIGLKMSNAIRAEDQIILTKKGVIDQADWDNRRYNGGRVDVDIPDGVDITKLFYKFQATDDAIGTFDSMMREVNSSLQTVSSEPNVNQRVSRTSPLANTTATAVGAMQESGDIKEGSYNEQFNYGIVGIARNNLVLAQQFFPEYFAVVSGPTQSERYLSKKEILGNAEITMRTALTNNKVFEAQRYLNAINTILNWRGTQDPAMLRISLEKLVKTALHRLDLGDINEIYPELPPQIQTQQAMPQTTPQGQLQNA